jgi:AcrR family transcriptional regulator
VANPSSRVYGGIGADERRAERRVRLLEAGLDLLGGEGWQASTVRAICSRAGLTPRYFYESFADRDALLLAVFDEVASELSAVVLAAVTPPPGDAHETARAAIGAGIELITADARKARVLFVEAMGAEPLARRRFETLRGFAQLVAEQARSFYGVSGGGDRMIDVSALMLVGGLAETFMAWLDGSLVVSKEQLVEDCADLFAAMGEGTLGLVRTRAALAASDRGGRSRR